MLVIADNQHDGLTVQVYAFGEDALRGPSILGGMGHISQKRDVSLLTILLSPGMSDCRTRVKSQARKASSSLMVLSILRAELPLHDVRLHRILPPARLAVLGHLLPEYGAVGCIQAEPCCFGQLVCQNNMF